ncbi:MAG: hypothetical protein II367_03380 [Treponema sp.]|nr:hypothetical protein [Treponema sp.]
MIITATTAILNIDSRKHGCPPFLWKPGWYTPARNSSMDYVALTGKFSKDGVLNRLWISVFEKSQY